MRHASGAGRSAKWRARYEAQQAVRESREGAVARVMERFPSCRPMSDAEAYVMWASRPNALEAVLDGIGDVVSQRVRDGKSLDPLADAREAKARGVRRRKGD